MKPPFLHARAVSLIEILTVLAVIGIMAVIATPAVSSLVRSSSLNSAGLMIADQFALARQEAVSKSRDIEVRFYFLTNGISPGWRGIQLWLLEQTPTGPVTRPCSRLAVIPDGTLISTNLSPLLTAAPYSGSVTLPSRGPASFRSFRFRANGSPENAIGTNNFITVINTGNADPAPQNYYTIQLNAVTGKATIFRP